MSEALEALYAGEVEKAHELLPPDEQLSVFEAAAFGRLDALRWSLDADPAQATALSDDGFTALHLAVFGGQEEAVRLLLERGADKSLATDDGRLPADYGLRDFLS